jgi:hypothetical protein
MQLRWEKMKLQKRGSTFPQFKHNSHEAIERDDEATLERGDKCPHTNLQISKKAAKRRRRPIVCR